MNPSHIAKISTAPWLLVLIAALPGTLIAETFPNLAVTGGVEAGTSDSAGGTELRLGGLILGKGIYSGAPTLLAGDQGPGTRILWYSGKAAFRAGRVGSNQWDEANLGSYSTAFGFNNTASGIASTAMGFWGLASGSYSTTMGVGTIALNHSSSAIGHYTVASAVGSTAMGSATIASGEVSTALGYGSIASGEIATATGNQSMASGTSSTSAGVLTVAESYASFVVGSQNEGGGDPFSWVATDPLFEIGNGDPTTTEDRSNALTVYKNGNMDVQGNIDAGGVITCAPGGDIPMFTGN